MLSARTKIVIIEDHAIVRGLAQRVAEDVFHDPEVFFAREGLAGVEQCRVNQPQLVLLDLELPDADGFELVHQIRHAARSAKILVLSAHTESYILHRVRQVNVDGFVDKNEQTPEMLAAAMRTVVDGGHYFSPSVENSLAQSRADPKSFTKLLSDREQELLRWFGKGAPDAAIAERFKLSQLTVRNHRRNIMAKVGVHSTPELIRYAIENGFTRMR